MGSARVNISDQLRDAAVRLGLKVQEHQRYARDLRAQARYPGNGEPKWARDEYSQEETAPLTIHAAMLDEADAHDAIAAAWEAHRRAAEAGTIIQGGRPSGLDGGPLKARRRVSAAWGKVAGEAPKVVGAALHAQALTAGQYVIPGVEDDGSDRGSAPGERDVDWWVAVRTADIKKRVMASKDPKRLGTVFEGDDRARGMIERTAGEPTVERPLPAGSGRPVSTTAADVAAAQRRISG